MITKDNLRQLLEHLGYKEKNNKYIYHFDSSNCEITVDFINEKIIYPLNKGLIVNENQTINFSDNENFVVLECIHRLLEKGYKPAHIEIEKRWSLGHLQKSGRADICVMNATGNDILFIIECKTYGDEFDKELKTLKSDGGQLFSYYQQEKSTKWLMLYAANYENGKIDHQVKTVPVFDSEDILEKSKKNKNIDLYENASSKEKAFETWVKTYDQKIYDDLIFSKDTIAYNIGEKPLRKKDLKEFNPRDKIVNKFEEILRHNNVSDKENAFNKLTALFICKLVDEITKGEEDIVDFQFKFGTDTYETLLDRLQRLYKEGMDKFMKEEIFYVSSEYPVKLFATYKGQNRKNAIEDLKETFRKLKFYSNSDFAFKDVHNKELFEQNGKILVEVVKLFEDYRIVYPSKHQFLGDLFEQLLNQGFKQNEGQFFTPIPITRFIWESLPIEDLKSLDNKDGYPKIIDYACGSGHFLTEGIDLINKVKGNTNNNWVSENIYGIEKDYRLARVSKISLFMNGAGDGNIIFGDGLDNHKSKGVENNSFDILVANPPYSVKAFKSHLELEENDFELKEFISNEGSEIEVLFVERIAQLLKPNGIAAVILPSTILTNASNSYKGARDVILKNFKIKSIAQFGSKTFGKTGQNTVVLFLEKYNEPPKYFKIIEDTVQAIFNNQKVSEWMDNEILDDYIEHIGVEKEIYIDFIEERNNYEDFIEDDYFKMYVDEFNSSTELKKLTNRKTFNNLTDKEKENKINSLFYSNVKEVEKDKLFYFALVREQETLVVKAPSKITEQYDYLGYKWSDSKGNEGIQLVKKGGVLYDPKNKENENRIAPLVKKFYRSSSIIIKKDLKEFVSILKTKNMLDFSREKFDRYVLLQEIKSLELKSKYDLQPLSDILETIGGLWKGEKEPLVKIKVLRGTNFTMTGQTEYNDVAIIDVEESKYKNRKLVQGDIVLEKSGGSETQAVGRVIYFNKTDKDYSFSNFCNRLRLRQDREKNINSYYIFLILNYIYQNGFTFDYQTGSSGLKNLNIGRYLSIKIPVPPIAVQEKIISECKKLEEKYEKTRMKIEAYKAQIQKIFEDLEVIKNDGGGYKLSDSNVFDISIGRRVLQNELTEKGIPVYSANVFEPMGNIDKYFINNFDKPHIIWGIDGDWMVNILPKGYEFYPTDHCGVMMVDESKINPRFIAYLLEKQGKTIGFSRTHRASIDRIKSISVEVPNIDIQNTKMDQVLNIEEKIEKLKENQLDLNVEINKVLQTFLN